MDTKIKNTIITTIITTLGMAIISYITWELQERRYEKRQKLQEISFAKEKKDSVSIVKALTVVLKPILEQKKVELRLPQLHYKKKCLENSLSKNYSDDDIASFEYLTGRFEFFWDKLESCISYIPPEDYKIIQKEFATLAYQLGSLYLKGASREELSRVTPKLIDFPTKVLKLIKRELRKTMDEINKITSTTK